MLDLKSITDINTPINTKLSYGKKVNEIKSLYEELKKETDEFFSKLNKDKSELVITENNNKKYVSTRTIEYNKTSLTTHGFEDKDEKRIKNAYLFINRDIIQYKEWLDNLIDNYEEIKNRIGIKKLRSDSKDFKEMILDTHQDLHNLKNEYEWVI